MSAMPLSGECTWSHVHFRVTKLLWREASYIAGLGVALFVYVWIGTTGENAFDRLFSVLFFLLSLFIKTLSSSVRTDSFFTRLHRRPHAHSTFANTIMKYALFALALAGAVSAQVSALFTCDS